MKNRLVPILVLIAILLSPIGGIRRVNAANPGDVVINEIMQNPSAVFDSAGEWFEVYNSTSASIDINGWTISDNDFDSHVINNGGPLIIPPGGFLVLGNNTDTATNGGAPVAYSYGSSWFLSNSADEVVLLDDTLTEIDRVEYDGGPNFPDPNGASMSLKEPSLDNNLGANWCTSTTPFGAGDLGTPGAVNTCESQATSLTIMEIQGSGQFSPFNGQSVETSGVVTLFTANGANFWLQDPTGDADLATSDGIFVAGGGFPDSGPRPAVGDRIRVIASVQEQQFGNALPLTRLRNVALIEILSSDNSLPASVPLVDLPNQSILEGIDFWEPLEGMLVSASDGSVIAATNGFGEFGFVTSADAIPGSGYFADTDHLIIRSTGTNEVDYNPERIMVDDSALDTPEVRPGDQVNSIVGVVDYTFGNYKLQVQSLDVTTNPLPSTPVSERTLGPDQGKGLGQFIRVVTYNVENLFDLFDNPDKDDIRTGGDETEAELDVHLTKLALSIEVELEEPDILVLQEVENTLVLTGDENGLVPGTSVPALIPRLNGQWEAISFETSDGRGIEVAFMWQKGRVKLLDGFQITDDIVPGTSAAFGPDSPSPGREPLVGKFKVRGHELWIVGNHFKSKSGDDPLYGVNQPPIRITEVQRKAQATVVRTFVNMLLDADPSALVMVTGDLNDFQFGEPGEGADHPVAILEGGSSEVPLTNLVNLEQESERFSFVFDGNSQVLDHMLVSPGLFAQFLGVDFLHFNTSFFDTLNSDPTTPLAASDHDPLEGRFNLGDD